MKTMQWLKILVLMLSGFVVDFVALALETHQINLTTILIMSLSNYLRYLLLNEILTFYSIPITNSVIVYEMVTKIFGARRFGDIMGFFK